MRDKSLYDLLDTDVKHQIEDPELQNHANKFFMNDYDNLDMDEIKHFLSNKLLSNPNNNIKGHETFSHTEFIIGVTQFIDNLIMKYGIKGVQILEHDYTYYQRLDPTIKFSQIGKLDQNKPLLISMPFAGHCDVHKQMDDILEECTAKNIDVHLDCAWLPCSENIQFDFNHPCIKSFASSLSKAYSLGWNRIGIRWTKKIDETDSITIYNRFNMYNKSLCKIGYHYAKKFPIDFLWNKYRNFYYNGCKQTYTFPTKIIWLSKGLYGELYGTNKLLQHLYNISVSN